MSILSPDIPHELLGASNKPVSWDEAIRLMRLGPQFPSHSGHVKRRLKALDAQPHPNGWGQLGPIDLNIKQGGVRWEVIGIYELFSEPPDRIPGLSEAMCAAYPRSLKGKLGLPAPRGSATKGPRLGSVYKRKGPSETHKSFSPPTCESAVEAQ